MNLYQLVLPQTLELLQRLNYDPVIFATERLQISFLKLFQRKRAEGRIAKSVIVRKSSFHWMLDLLRED